MNSKRRIIFVYYFFNSRFSFHIYLFIFLLDHLLCITHKQHKKKCLKPLAKGILATDKSESEEDSLAFPPTMAR